MRPGEFIQGLVDGTTRFLQSYLRFIFLTLLHPLRGIARQYYRSMLATERDMSPLSFLFTSVFVASVLYIGFPLVTHLGLHDSVSSAIRNSNTDALLPIIAGALVMTILFDFYVFLFHRRGLVGLHRAKRFHHMIILAAALAIFWSTVGEIVVGNAATLLLGQERFRRIFALGSNHISFVDYLFMDDREKTRQAAVEWWIMTVPQQAVSLTVIYLLILPLSIYLHKSRYNKSRRFNGLRTVAFPAIIAVVLLALHQLSNITKSEVSGNVEVAYIECNMRPIHGQPLAGHIVVRNSTSSDQMLLLNGWTLKADWATFFSNPDGPKGPGGKLNGMEDFVSMNGSEVRINLDKTDNADAVVLKPGESKVFRYRTEPDFDAAKTLRGDGWISQPCDIEGMGFNQAI